MARRSPSAAPLQPEQLPAATAAEAGLHYASDAGLGIRRRKSGRGFRFTNPDGSSVTDEITLKRIRSLAIPPAYKAVWISPDPLAHLQATAFDDRGRKQYRYHPRWTQLRDETKYDRMFSFGSALPTIRARVAEDLKLPGLPREKLLAALVDLLEKTSARIGNDEYAKTNGSYGLTTLKNNHAETTPTKVKFHFRGKSGIFHDLELRDARLAKVIAKLQDLPGQDLFQYMDEDGSIHPIGSGDVNAYIKEVSGHAFTAKDFRTWTATLHAAQFLAAHPAPSSRAEIRKVTAQAVKKVSQELGNTPSICRKCYIHPLILKAYEKGRLPKAPATETAILGLLG